MTASYSAAQSYLFDRRYQIDIVPYGQTEGVTYGNLGDKAAGLRVQFEIERKLASAADKAKIQVFNLTAEVRNAITRGCTIRLQAGYRGRTGLLFVGYVRKVKTEQNGPDTVTSMECGDGEPVLAYAPVNRSYAQATSLAQVLQDIAGDMKLSLGGAIEQVSPGVIKGIPNVTIPAGRVFVGNIRKVLDGILKPLKIDWSLQNGRLLILPRDGVVLLSAVVLSAQTGMTGVPSFTEKYLAVDSLLNSNLAPGTYVQIISSNRLVSGYYKLRSCKYVGDSHEQPWTVSSEAEVIKEPLPFYRSAVGNAFQKAVS